jgi:Amt family ammonium transporter
MRKNYFKRDFIHNFVALFFKLFHNRQSCLTVAVKFDTGDTAWMIVATALLVLTPGLGFFYGGMVGKKMLLVPCYKVLWL